MTAMMRQIMTYNLQFEEHVRSVEAEVELPEGEEGFQKTSRTFEQDLNEVEEALEDLKAKFLSLKVALFKSGNPKSGLKALRESWKCEASGESKGLQQVHTPEQPSPSMFPSQTPHDGSFSSETLEANWPLRLHEYKRYGRQLIIPEVGLSGQLKLKSSKVLIIGAGGLGCPAAAYIAGAGVGHITIVDGDVVEMSNLHRQIMHTTEWLGKPKAESLVNALQLINPNLSYEARTQYFEPAHAELYKDFSIILDCTDRPSSRYLISDVATTLGIPLVSASALKSEGQIMILNDPPAPAGDPSGGPCYRCIFPKPPPAEAVLSCGEGGILGPVVGVMGVLQALETIKVLTRPEGYNPQPPSMLMFSAYGTPMFRSMKIRRRNPVCKACSTSAAISLETLRHGAVDYVTFCGATAHGIVLEPKERVAAKQYAHVREHEKHILMDVRDKSQFELCSLSGSINIPFSVVQRWRSRDEIVTALGLDPQESQRIYVVCRLGNDSQIAVRKLKEVGMEEIGYGGIFDIEGGYRAWRRDVDKDWPDY